MTKQSKVAKGYRKSHNLWKKISQRNGSSGAVFKSNPKYKKIKKQFDAAKKRQGR